MNTADVLSLVKIRLNRPPGDTALDEYFTRRIEAAIARLEKTGIHLTGGVDDVMFLVDYTVWQYQNRDKPGDMPDWLRLERRERWLGDLFWTGESRKSMPAATLRRRAKSPSGQKPCAFAAGTPN